MSQSPPNDPATRKRPAKWLGMAGSAAAAAILIVALGPYLLSGAGDANALTARPLGFDIDLWRQISPIIQAHILAAVAAFVIGVLILSRPKGTGMHKTFGWAWVIAMAATAGTSFFITGLNGDHFSLIHLLSGWTLIVLPMAIFAIRRGDVKAHRASMMGTLIGGLVIAGALTFIPGRIMWRLFFG